MVALPLFFLSNLVLLVGATMTGGCAIPQDSVSQMEVVVQQQGEVSLASTDHAIPYTIRFDYQQYANQSYTMTLKPFLLSPIHIFMNAEQQIHLVINDVEYSQEDSLAMLDAYVPHFPWNELPLIVAQGKLTHSQWTIDDWTHSRFKMHAIEGGFMEWKVAYQA